MRNTEIGKVLLAVSRGYRTRDAIAEAAGLSKTATQTYLTRLISRGQVESKKSPVPEEYTARVKHYHVKGLTPFLLQNVWSTKFMDAHGR